MRIIVEKQAAGEAPQSEEVEATAVAVADSLAAGYGISPLRDGTGAKAPFVGADWAFIQLASTAEHVERLLGHEFTVANAATACLEADGAQVRCIVGFALPTRIKNIGDYRAVLAGLAVVYGVEPRKDCLTPWRMDGGGEATALPGSITRYTFGMLLALGKEELHRRQYRIDGTIRSDVRLPRDAVVTLGDGDTVELQALAIGTAIRCPVHADLKGEAEVVRHGVYCPRCHRTFGSGPGPVGHDFDQFQRGFAELLEQQQAEIGDSVNPDLRLLITLSERYLPPVQLRPGFTLVRSPKGTGKTKALEALVAQCKAHGKRVLLVGHRRSLLGNLARRLKLNLYFEAEGQEASREVDSGIGTTQDRRLLVYEGEAPSPSLADLDPHRTSYFAVCLDSVPHRLNPAHHKYDVVIVDESEQVVQHLVSSTLKRVRRDAFYKLRHYLRYAESVYLLDADLDLLTWSMVCAALDSGIPGAPSLPDVRIIVNTPPAAERSFELVGTRALLMAALVDAVAGGGKTYVACNSIKEVQKIAAYLRTTFPDKRIVDITSANSQEPEVLQMISDLPGEYDRGLDVLIASPALGTGVDISFDDDRCGIPHVFGLFYGNVVTHFDIDQQLCRVRNPGSVKVWIDPKGTQYETAPEVIARELRYTVLRTDLVIDYDREGRPVFASADTPLVDLWSKIVAMQRASKNRLLPLFSELRAKNGWSASVVAGTENDTERGKTALSAGKELREAERVQRILSAPDIPASDAEELIERVRNSEPITQAEQAMLERYWISSFYVAPVDKDLIELDDEGRTRTKIALLELLYKEERLLAGHDRFQVNNEHFIDPRYFTKVPTIKPERAANNHVRRNSSRAPFDRDFWSAKAALLKELLAAAGVIDPGTGEFLLTAEVTAASLGPFAALFRKKRRQIESELGLVMRSDIDRKSTQQLGDLLRSIALDLPKVAERKVGTAKERVYRVDGDLYGRMLEIIVRREQRSRLRRAEKADAPEADDVDRDPGGDDEQAPSESDMTAFSAAVSRMKPAGPATRRRSGTTTRMER